MMKQWILRIGFTTIFTCACLFLVSRVEAWQIPVEVAVSSETGDKSYVKMVIGMENGATDGYDNLWDAPALSSHPDPERALVLSAYINGKDKTGETGRLWKDIRGTGKSDNTEWIINVAPQPVGKNVSVQWNIPVGMFGTGEKLVLKDSSNLDKDGRPAETNILSKQGYEFTSDGDGDKKLSIVYSKESSGSSSGGSGFGCGTIKEGRGDSAGPGAIDMIALILFSPFVLRLIRKSLHS